MSHAPASCMQGSTRARLILDHEDLEADLDELIRAFEMGDWSIARAAFAGFERRLANHFEREEQLLFPDFAQTFPRETLTLLEEHQTIRRRVEELGIGIDVHQTRVTTIRELASLIRHHAAREDKLFYRWTDNQFSSDTTSLFTHGRSPPRPERF